jgi:predicted phage terminase large subunit-like protein
MEDEQFNRHKNYYAGVDLAISDADKSAFTAIVVGGVDEYNNLTIENVVRLRDDVYGIISVLLALQQKYDIQGWYIEKGQISMSIEGELYRRQHESNIYLNGLQFVTPTKDKRARARAIQARIRAGTVYFNREAEWYPAFEHELIMFPKGIYKDQVDALAWLGICVQNLSTGPSNDEYEEERWMEAMERINFNDYSNDADELTGY